MKKKIIRDALKELENDTFEHKEVPVPIGGPYYHEVALDEHDWLTLHYEIRRVFGKKEIHILAVRIGLKF